MRAYLKFLFISMFTKVSTWVVSFIYIFTIISFIYIIPSVLNWSLSKTFSYVSLILLIVIIIATCSSYITATIFRSGIDDGTELLVLSKEIGRSNIIWSKVIVLITIETILSLFCAFLAFFSKYFEYGNSNPTPYVIGIFLIYLIVGIFFSSITILFSLKLKRSSLTLLSTAISVMLSILCFVNYLVAKTPGIYNNIDSYTISQNALFKKTNNSNMEIQDGYNLYFNYYPVTSETTNYNGELIINEDNMNNVIQTIYNQNLQKTNFLNTSKIDLGFQWTQLMNLSNFIHNNETTEPTSVSPSALFNSSVMSNYYLEFQQIDVETNNEKYISYNIYNDSLKLNVVPFSTRENFSIINNINFVKEAKSISSIDNEYYSLYNNKIYIPILINVNQELKIRLVQFDNPYLIKSSIIIEYLIKNFNILDKYNNFLEYISKDNYFFSQFLLTLLFNNYSNLIEEVNNYQDIKIVDENNKIINVIKNSDIKNILKNYFYINLKFNDINPSDYFNNDNIISTKSIITFCLQSLESIQLSIVQYLEQINFKSGIINDNNENLKIASGIFKNTTLENNYTNFYVYKNNDDILSNSIILNDIPVSTTNSENFNTFAIAKFNTYLNLYGTVFGWLSICIIFISISTYFYYKKDFK